MGCFGYICKGCCTQIVGDYDEGGENCIMIHVRYGKEMGRVEGHYDEYGRVAEQYELEGEERFRGDHGGINGHSEICDSESRKEDSYRRINELRIYEGKGLMYHDFIGEVMKKEVLVFKDDITQSHLFDYLNDYRRMKILEYQAKGEMDRANMLFTSGNWDVGWNRALKEYDIFHKELPMVTRAEYSGVVSWHSLCYNNATEKDKGNLIPSEDDPNQSWGKVRKKYS